MAVNSFNAQNPPVTTKGDVFTFSTIPTRLGVGANDTVLTADSSTATGLKWNNPIPSQTGNSGKYLTTNGTSTSWGTISSGGFTQLASGTLGSAGTNLTSISGSYIDLVLVVNNYRPSSSNGQLYMRFNSDTGTNYDTTDSGNATGRTPSSTIILIDSTASNYSSYGTAVCRIFNYASTNTMRLGQAKSIGYTQNNSSQRNMYNFNISWWNETNAITTINLLPNAGTITTGDYILYGVK